MRTRLTGRFVIGYAGGDHAIYPGGEVVYEGDTITFVGHGYPGPVDVSHDYGDAIISQVSSTSTRSRISITPSSDTWLTPERQRGQQWSEQYFHQERRRPFPSRMRSSSGATRSCSSS